MRVHNRKWKIWSRRITALLLLCGLFLFDLPKIYAASVTYEYTWIKSTTDLPTDNEWHDYFIAWEDLDDKNKVWFTDYHWYTADGIDNIDVGGSSWMEYKAPSTLPNSTAGKFTSRDCLGHMQIKYAGMDKDNHYAPMYYIRLSRMNGGYSYLTRSEPTNNASEADAFTFDDQGSVFHIFVNVSGAADKYLTRDDDQLETTLSSSAYGKGKYRDMRIYQRSFTVKETEQGAVGAASIGKMDVYECYWVNEPQELLDLAASEKGWQDVIIAWDTGYQMEDGTIHSFPGMTWYTKEAWEDNGVANYVNDYQDGRYAYWSNDMLGSGYTTTGESFIVPEKVGHFQIKHVGWDDDNPVKGISGHLGFDVDSPVFNIRFSVGSNVNFYLGEDEFSTDSSDADTYTIQMFGDPADFADASYNHNYLGYVHIFSNWAAAEDEYLARDNNRLYLMEHDDDADWRYYLRLYAYRTVQYDAIVKSFTIGNGATYSIDRQLVLKEDVSITVEDGGVLMVDRQLLNNGSIVVNKGGTVIVNEGGYIMPFGEKGEGTITLNGGNLIIMDNAKVICDQGDGTLLARNGATIVNRGVLLVSKALELRNSSYLKNEPTGTLVLGGVLAESRGAVNELSAGQFTKAIKNVSCAFLCSAKAKLLNEGTISVPVAAASMLKGEGSGSVLDRGKIVKR